MRPAQDNMTLPPMQGNRQPVPGYRLIRPLGRGAGAVVWEAEGPGRFRVALKLVPLSTRLSDRELRSLEIIRVIHHPNLLAVFGSWQVENFLVIGMELADRSLWDRYLESESQGLRGIPRPELLRYLADAAEAIDYLNDHRHSIEGRQGIGIQHCDLKPQNILLMGTCAKVADFGLARVMDRSLASHNGACTLAYAAPEFFSGRTSRQSDQYALAVTYCQLRGGRMPFRGTNAQLAAGHLMSEPDLEGLPSLERPIVERALSKNPSQRWPDCRSFLGALKDLRPTEECELLDEIPGRFDLDEEFGPDSEEGESGSTADSDFILEDESDAEIPIVAWSHDADAPEAPTSPMAPLIQPAAVASDFLLPEEFAEGSSFEGREVLPAEPARVVQEERGRPVWMRAASVGVLAVIGAAVLVPIVRSPIDGTRHASATMARDVMRVERPGPALRPSASRDGRLPTSAAPDLPAEVRRGPSLASVVSPDPASSDPVRPGTSGTRRLAVGATRTLAVLKRAWTDALGSEAVQRRLPSLSSSGNRDVAKAPAPGTLPVFHEARFVQPTRASEALERGRAQLARRSYEPAVAAFTEAIRIDPTDFAARHDRAIAYHFLGRHRDALVDYNELIRLQPNNAEAYLLRARIHAALGKTTLALKDCDEAIRLLPNAMAHLARGQFRHDLGAYDDALADFNAAIRFQPRSAQVYYQRGLARYHTGDNAGAIADLTQAIRIDPAHAMAYRYRGDAYARSGDEAHATADHDRFETLAKRTRPRPTPGTPKGRLGDLH